MTLSTWQTFSRFFFFPRNPYYVYFTRTVAIERDRKIENKTQEINNEHTVLRSSTLKP